MTISINEFMKDFTTAEHEQVSARTAALIEEEMVRQRTHQAHGPSRGEQTLLTQEDSITKRP